MLQNAHGLLADSLTPFIEEWKLATGLIQAAAQPAELRGGRVGDMFGDGNDGHFSHPLQSSPLILSKSFSAEKTKTTGCFGLWLQSESAAERRLRKLR